MDLGFDLQQQNPHPSLQPRRKQHNSTTTIVSPASSRQNLWTNARRCDLAPSNARRCDLAPSSDLLRSQIWSEVGLNHDMEIEKVTTKEVGEDSRRRTGSQRRRCWKASAWTR
ncbi:uncharacterized protein LOC119295125 [Triticum dicoccoides]|uniref:uncharacterized protein LOC119295125 n=1 Tax=Triticum dicoccoides TaxID=85692 RepID=UPI0018906C15|nr:uncharacterized protein LOC119295125 [Triticum dicoccoides]